MAAVAGDGTVYVAFQDQTFSPGKNDILLTHSSDGGNSWSPPVDATPDPLLDHFTPAIDVVGPTIHLTYRTHVGDVNVNPLVDAVYRRVTSGGTTTFGPTLLKTSDASVAAFTKVASTAQFQFFGDYAGIAASSISAHPIWGQAELFPDAQTNPTNTHQRSFSARIQ